MGASVAPVDLKYPKLQSPSADIRLLELQPSDNPGSPICAEYHVVNLGSATRRYETLSYTWGDLNADNEKTIYIDSTPVFVSSSLFSAIEMLRLPRDTRRLWIDALCINQTDLEEKMQQVNMMGQIYSQCASCNIWLGDLGGVDRLDAQDAFDLISCYADEVHEPGPTWLANPARRDSALNLINSIMSLSWWHRVWTVQEAVLPPHATMHWGPCRISWATTSAAALNMVRSAYPGWMRPFLSDVPGDKLNPFTGYVIGMLKARHDNHCGLLVRWRYRKATNPLDKVYALLGFRDDLLRELPSVGSCDYTLAPRVLFARVSADIIHAYGSLEPAIGHRGGVPATEGLPSWATDYVGVRPGTPDVFRFWPHDGAWIHRGYAASEGIEAPAPVVEDHRVLHVAGYCVDTIDIVEQRVGDGTIDEHSDRRESVPEIISRRMHSGRLLIRDWLSARPEGSELEDYDRYVEDLDNVLRGQLVPGTSHRDDWGMQHAWVDEMVAEQAIFITRQGLIGIGPLNAQPGQEVWALARCRFPFILESLTVEEVGVTRIDKDEYKLAGDCFVRGIMMGEAAKKDTVQKQRNIRIL